MVKKNTAAAFNIEEAETELEGLYLEQGQLIAQMNRPNGRKDQKALNKLYKRDEQIRNRMTVLEDELREAKKTPKERELEGKFKAAISDSQKQVDVHLKAAMAELKKAFSVAEKTGIPFTSEICDTYNTYVPKSFKTKWKNKLSEEFLEDLMEDDLIELGEDFGDYGGWTSSYC